MTEEKILKLAIQHANSVWRMPDGTPTTLDFTPDRLQAFARDLLAKDGTREHWRRTFAAAALPAFLGKNNHSIYTAVDAAMDAARAMEQQFFPEGA